MKKLRRDRLKIYGDLLAILYDESKKGKFTLTRVQVRLKVPFDRMKKYIAELSALELIENEESLKLTEKGKKYLREYEKVLDFMEDMGIGYE